MGVRATQDLTIQHPGQDDVRGVLSLPRGPLYSINVGHPLAYYREGLSRFGPLRRRYTGDNPLREPEPYLLEPSSLGLCPS